MPWHMRRRCAPVERRSLQFSKPKTKSEVFIVPPDESFVFELGLPTVETLAKSLSGSLLGLQARCSQFSKVERAG